VRRGGLGFGALPVPLPRHARNHAAAAVLARGAAASTAARGNARSARGSGSARGRLCIADRRRASKRRCCRC
jgi:hypothetical protein